MLRWRTNKLPNDKVSHFPFHSATTTAAQSVRTKVTCLRVLAEKHKTWQTYTTHVAIQLIDIKCALTFFSVTVKLASWVVTLLHVWDFTLNSLIFARAHNHLLPICSMPIFTVDTHDNLSACRHSIYSSLNLSGHPISSVRILWPSSSTFCEVILAVWGRALSWWNITPFRFTKAGLFSSKLGSNALIADSRVEH